jgi:hypothetical protein
VAARAVIGGSVVPVGVVVVLVVGASKASEPLASEEQSWWPLSAASRRAERMSLSRVRSPTAQNGVTAARATSRFQPTGWRLASSKSPSALRMAARKRGEGADGEHPPGGLGAGAGEVVVAQRPGLGAGPGGRPGRGPDLVLLPVGIGVRGSVAHVTSSR